MRERLKLLKKKNYQSSSGIKTPVSPCKPQFPIPNIIKFNESETKIIQKVLYFIKLKLPLNKEPPTGKKVNYNFIIKLSIQKFLD